FLRTASRLKSKTPFAILAYCLMGNHFHLAIKVEHTPLNQIMQRLLTTYVTSFNSRHQREGHLFQARYKAVLCVDDAYLLALVRYIHLNPVRARLVTNPEDWPWSSYLAYAGRTAPAFIDTELVNELLQSSGETFSNWGSKTSEPFIPWPSSEASAPPLIRSESNARPEIQELAQRLFPDAAEAEALRSGSRRRELVDKKRILAREAIGSGHSLAALARWFGCTVGAVHYLCR
ncbi:MAG: transposase, partial [Elusimicrobia bacterium]|nr:transposase [Elusimicrobiota bacterium]